MINPAYTPIHRSLSDKINILLLISLVILLGASFNLAAAGKLSKNDILWGVARGGWCWPDKPCDDTSVIDAFFVNQPDQQGASICLKRCILNRQCRSWNYVRRGSGCMSPQGPAICNLKSSVSDPTENRCYASGYINPLVNLQTCREIGNTSGEGTVECIGEGGRDFGKAGKGFLKDDQVWILMRLRRLHLGEKTASVHYSKVMNGKWKNFSKNKREWKFTNSSSSWAHWFKAHFSSTGSWRGSVSVRGPDLPGYVLGQVEYTVGGPFE